MNPAMDLVLSQRKTTPILFKQYFFIKLVIALACHVIDGCSTLRRT